MKRRCAGCYAVIDGHANRLYCTPACQERAYRKKKSSTETVLDYGPVSTVIRGTNGRLIATVARLGYLGGPNDVVLDVTYGRGMWWTMYRPERLRTHDLAIDGVDFRNLPEANDTHPIICYDPPYISTGSRTASTVDDLYDRFGLGDARGWRQIRQLIDDGLADCARVLAPGGYLLVKCMDYVESGRKVWNGFHVYNHGEAMGLRLVDRFIHLTGGGPQVLINQDGSPREQKHAREVSSLLLVFTK